MASAHDIETLTTLLGRPPQGAFEIVVRRQGRGEPASLGDPVVIRNAPFMDDGQPMPTLYWLVDRELVAEVSRLESERGVRAIEADIDADALAAAHAVYAAERDGEIRSEHLGPRPSGGVGGTRVGLKCLHAHYAWFLAGGDDPTGRWVSARLAERAAAEGRPLDLFTIEGAQ